ncbi:hypothetical protein [Salegentibacter salarius]|uniref:Nucleotide exchange factor GrpE n=1 Tax=Salegentibacter salarius TaxID=435906 RepID=A0A2N0TXA7_9FLAO|nr:hypothetical protein [Salegentibacter salarius]OEY72828.1 hypothetical protein BHS39_11335 [Salegentibacter salarius]PKD19288.1 hypothetical protein APR40_11315 [Salegentibacter salarius]SLK00027.1 hypothetical protein SAMN05660445_02314 [Salegentibacter salarius]
MKKLLLISLFLGATNLLAQQSDSTIVKEIQSLRTEVKQQGQDILRVYGELDKEYRTYRQVRNQFNDTVRKQRKTIDSLSNILNRNNIELASVNNDLTGKIQKADTDAKNSISELDENLSKNRNFWIIGTLILLVLGGVIYWLLSKRISSSKTDVESQIKKTKASLEEESVKLDSKLMEVLDTQLKLKDLSQIGKPEDEKKDHSLVVKVADEVTRILMNLEVMDKNIKGYKHLKKYSESILDNLKAYGYEIPQLTGQNYNSGMNMVATMESDDSIEEGKEIIKRIIKPQINYNGKMIQAAKVIVAYNE